ncbi:MAG: AAA family ATPase [Bacteroides sp.]|nr:AAA family ATPase [Bacteroides sp.]
MGFEFPLSISQRKSLYTFLDGKGKVFAVNGPPGTGKTTLLQSVVANAMVQSVLENGGNIPAIILACSANNQAVTNIIESFMRSKTAPGRLEGRWIPEVEGYATYLPGSTKKEEEFKGINYKKINGEGLFRHIESQEFLRKAGQHYLERANIYLGHSGLSLQESIAGLKEEIQNIQQQFRKSADNWHSYLEGLKMWQESVFPSLLNDAETENNVPDNERLEQAKRHVERGEQAVIDYFNQESFSVNSYVCLTLNQHGPVGKLN